MRLINKFIGVISVFFMALCHSFGQCSTILINQETIVAPPAPAPSVIPIVYTTCTTVDYAAETEITLTDGFWAKENTNNDGAFFIAHLVAPISYADLKDELDAGFCATRSGKLYFKYVEKYGDGVLDYQIYNYQRIAMIPTAMKTGSGSLTLNKKLGTNFLSLDLLASQLTFVGTNDTDSFYILEVTSAKGDKYFLRFKLLTSTNY